MEKKGEESRQRENDHGFTRDRRASIICSFLLLFLLLSLGSCSCLVDLNRSHGRLLVERQEPLSWIPERFERMLLLAKLLFQSESAKVRGDSAYPTSI